MGRQESRLMALLRQEEVKGRAVVQEHKERKAKTENIHPGDWRYKESNSQEGCKSHCCLLLSQVGIDVASLALHL